MSIACGRKIDVRTSRTIASGFYSSICIYVAAYIKNIYTKRLFLSDNNYIYNDFVINKRIRISVDSSHEK